MTTNTSARPSGNVGKLKTRRQNQPHSEPILYLRQSRATFEPPTSKESVFFDECNREIINLTSNIEGKTKVLFQSAELPDRLQFLLPVEKRILSIKLNPSRSILAYHLEKSTIEFINIVTKRKSSRSDEPLYELESRRYQQSSRARNAKLSGFLWTGQNEMVIITDISVEYYHLDSQRHRLKHIKSFPSSTNWFVYQPKAQETHSMLVVSTGSIGNSMQPYAFIANQVVKLQRFEVEGNWHGSNKLELFERSITIASVYGLTRLLVLQHESLNLKTKGAQILIYTICCDTGSTTKTHTLDLDINGRFALNVVDNLIIAHDQPSRSSFIFDVMIESTEKSDCPSHYVSLIDSQPIRTLEVGEKSIQMYSLNWVFFQPNFIIDAKVGLLCTLQIDLDRVRRAIRDNSLLLTFLSHRSEAETIILSQVRGVIDKSFELASNDRPSKGNTLAEVSASFEVLANLVVSQPELERKPAQQKGRLDPQITPNAPNAGAKTSTSISQEYIHRDLFQPFDVHDNHVSWTNSQNRHLIPDLNIPPTLKQNESHLNFVISILLEFIFMVRRQSKNVDFRVYESLLKSLAAGRRYYQIVQMMRMGIFRDSKQLACVLLSMRDHFRPAAQMGIDMLNRLDCLTDLIESLNLDVGPLYDGPEISRRLSDALNQSLELDAA